MSLPPLTGAKIHPRLATAGWTLAAIALIGINLRPAVAGLGPILPEIVRALGLNGATAGVLTTAPVICFGIAGPFAPGLAARFGMERVILIFLALIAVGTGIRGLGGLGPLYLGMLVAGLSIGAINVLLPSIVKQDFPRRIGMVMGLYTSALCLGAAGSALLSPPFEAVTRGDWRGALAVWAAPAILAGLLWLPQLSRARPAQKARGSIAHSLWRNALAWQVTLFLTCLTATAYAQFAWGGKLLQDRGMSVDGSAEQLALSAIVQAVSGYFMPYWAAKMRDQRLLAALGVAGSMVGFLGLIFAPLSLATLCTTLYGLGQGGAFGIALALLALRAGSAQSAARLSGMAQSVCYIVGGLIGPFMVGIVHDWSGGWSAVGVLFAVTQLLCIAAALGAGRAGTVDGPRTAAT